MSYRRIVLNLLNSIRTHIHPFHRLKKVRFFSEHILPRLDWPLFRKLHGIAWPVRMRLMRHLSYVIENRVVEPGIGSLHVALCNIFRIQGFWDVGANIGYYSWLILSECPSARAILFEPDNDNLALIDATITRNNLKRANVIPCAVGDRNGEFDFIVDSVSGLTGSLDLGEATFVERNYGLVQTKTKIKVVTLDSLIPNEIKPELIKIDIEGAEHLAFAGAKSLIDTIQPILIFECSRSNFPSLTDRLKGSGYRLFSADSPDGVLRDAENILALPRSRLDSVDDLMNEWRSQYAQWIGRG